MKPKNQHTDLLIETLSSGRSALLLSGNIFDYVVVDGKLAYRPQYILEELHKKCYSVITYSRAEGLGVHRLEDQPDLQNILRTYGLSDALTNKQTVDEQEIVLIFRNIKRMLQHPQLGKRIAIVVNYSSHIGSHQPSGGASSSESIFAEIAHLLASLPSLSKNGHAMLLIDDGSAILSPLITTQYHQVAYCYPTKQAYSDFYEVVAQQPAKYAQTSLAIEEFVSLARGLRLFDLMNLFKDFRDKERVVTRKDLLQQKTELINRISENTLEVINVENPVELGGMEVVKAFLDSAAEKLKQGDATAPRAILLSGPPGTGKSTLAKAFAYQAGFNLVRFKEVKNMYVGESERRLAKALSILESLENTVLFIDEIDQQFKSREQANMDGGVSSNQLAEVFQFTARDDLRGKVVVLAASNTPNLLDPAMASRFTVLPVLEPVPNELTQIFPVIEKQITGHASIESTDKRVIEACEIIYKKGATPRNLWDIINHCLAYYGSLSPENILKAAKSFRSGVDPWSIALSSLVSIDMAGFQEFLPWSNNPTVYAYPWYLEGVIDKQTGVIDETELSKSISEARKNAKY